MMKVMGAGRPLIFKGCPLSLVNCPWQGNHTETESPNPLATTTNHVPRGKDRFFVNR